MTTRTDPFDNIIPGDYYRHNKSGRIYRVVCCALRESDGTPVVVYVAEQPGLTAQTLPWTRPTSEWFEIVKQPDGYRRPRFAWHRAGESS